MRRRLLRHFAFGLIVAMFAAAVVSAAPAAPAAPASAPAAKASPAPAGDTVGYQRPVLAHPNLLAIGIIQVLLSIVFAAAVFYVCNWAFLDVRFVNTDPLAWGGIVLGGALAGLAATFLVPLFYIGLPLGIAIFAGAVFAYAKHRNVLVTPALTVLTQAHYNRITRRMKGLKAVEAGDGPVIGAGRDIIFVGLDDLPIHLELDSEAQRQAFREVERVFYDAIVRRASTVGYLARPQKGEVRYRISGETVAGADVDRPAADHFAAIVRRLAGLDPEEVRKPQEGRIRAIVMSLPFELRIKTAGTVKGEQVAVRIIDISASQMRLDQLGLTDLQLVTLKEALGARPGLVIISGPQDSGLTTTMHACLRNFDRYINNIIVFEPHVDVEVENVQHIPVNQEDGPIVTAEVRSRLRMEPDVVGFDSLYLPETAQALIEGAREHTVIVGVRAVDATQAMTRMASLLGGPQALSERLQCVVNQRLVRLLCQDCKEAYRPNPEFLRKANLGAARVDLLYRPPTRTDEQGKPIGCPRCHTERYMGRTGLFEVMPVDAVVRDMIGREGGFTEVRTYLRKMGMRNLQEEGLQMVIEGRTSIEEVLRAVKQAT